MSDFTTWQMNVNLLLDYKEKYWGGLSYRIQDAVSFILGIKVLNGLSIDTRMICLHRKLLRRAMGRTNYFYLTNLDYLWQEGQKIKVYEFFK